MELAKEKKSKNNLKNKLKNEIKQELKTELKNEFKSDIKNEVDTGHKPIPIKIVIKVMKSICKITIEKKDGKTSKGTGFFLNCGDSMQCLITNYHVLNPYSDNEDISIEIHNKKIMKLKYKNRFTKFKDKPKDMAMIEIKKSDVIYKDIEFLDYDYNCVKSRYSTYKDVDVFSIEHPNGEDASCASGTIIKINGYEFTHNISTDKGSSGCPVILLNNNINLIQVIGIHRGGDKKNKINAGTFIGEIINNNNIIKININNKNISFNNNSNINHNKNGNNNAKNKINNNNNNNYIISEIYIKDENINKKIRLINSYEESMKASMFKLENNYKNENEIKKCEITINDESIPFNYFHKFKSKGKYRIKYSFKNTINKACYMFSECDLLININLSNLKTNNITDMSCIFLECSSLTNIDLSNVNTNNVTDMSCMFFGCSSLNNIDLSYFNTDKVTDMNNMFSGCSSLTNINLTTFNTDNVTDMNSMFVWCSSLTNIDLSNFYTNNVTNMINMFYGCSALTNINLFNFNTKNVTNMVGMFSRCPSLKKENIITKDKKILNEINKFHC